ncbi:MAG: transporter family protein [Limisphaerales bacterium]
MGRPACLPANPSHHPLTAYFQMTNSIQFRSYHRRNMAALTGAFLVAVRLQAHEEGAPFSGAIIDPPLLHHAHIENEQRFNFFVLRGVRDGAGRKRTGYEGELELAYGTPNFKYGAELFVPLVNLPEPNGDGRFTGVGDIEIRPLKYALVMKPDFVVSTASAFGLPTGSKADGLGSGNASFAQLLFLDKAQGNWAVGLNLGLGTNLGGERESVFGYGVGLSYSFIRGTRFREVAATVPKQKWVVAPSVELVGERILRGDAAGQYSTSVAPGVSFWHVRTGWQLRFGVLFPLWGQRETDRALMFQVGNHLNWGRLLGLKRDREE